MCCVLMEMRPYFGAFSTLFAVKKLMLVLLDFVSFSKVQDLSRI